MTTVLPLVAIATPSWMMYAGIGALGLGLLVLLVMAIPRQRALTTEERIVQYAARAGTGMPASAPISAAKVEAAALDSAKQAAAKVLKRNAGLEVKIAQRLDGAAPQGR